MTAEAQAVLVELLPAVAEAEAVAVLLEFSPAEVQAVLAELLSVVLLSMVQQDYSDVASRARILLCELLTLLILWLLVSWLEAASHLWPRTDVSSRQKAQAFERSLCCLYAGSHSFEWKNYYAADSHWRDCHPM